MIGQTISQYKILEKLGEGGMGIVYKAHDSKLNRTVALKFLPHHLSSTPEEEARFLQEAQAAATLNHPNVCTIFDIKEHDKQQFIVMECIEGVTLRKKIASGALSLENAIAYALQIGDALHEAHQKGIVHRDIKADNIMVNTKNSVKVMDFGLAKLKGSLKLTRTSSTVGTLAYMAPEQIQGGEVDARSDIFSFGVVLYEMLTGRMPFRGDHEAAMMYSILNEEPETLQKYLPEAPSELLHVFGRALEKNPEDRYQSVHDMVIDLRRLKKESTKVSRASMPAMNVAPQASTTFAPAPTTTVTVSQPTQPLPSEALKPPKRWLIPSAISIVIVVLGIVAYFFLLPKGENGNGERLPIAVADFVNQTGEKELDGLSGMLITAMEQSRRLSVLTRSRMFDILKSMGNTNVDKIDESLGKAICNQANIGALVTASIRKFGKLYTIDLKVLDPRKNEYIFTAKEEGEGQENIPAMLDKLSEKTRLGLKEKATEVRAATQKIAEATTTNLQAYQYYFEGEQLINKLKFKEAAEEFGKAVAIDTTFGLAYYRMAYALAWGSDPGAEDAINKAMQYIDKIPEKERYYVRGEHAIIQKDVQRGLSIYKELISLYPNEKEAIYIIGDYSFHLQDYPAAIAHLERVLAMDPTFERAYQHLCWTYSVRREYDMKMQFARQYVTKVPAVESYLLFADTYVNQEKFDSALQIFSRALEAFPNNGRIIQDIGATYLMQNELVKSETEYDRLIHPSRTAEDQRNGYWGLINVNILRGKYREAVRMVDRIQEINLHQDDKPSLGMNHAWKAVYFKELLGDADAARSELQQADEYREAGDLNYYIGIYNALIALGDFVKAREIGKTKLSTVFPKFDYHVDGYQSMSSGNYVAAITSFKALEPVINQTELLRLAECYVATEQIDKAIEVVQRLQRTYSTLFNFPADRARTLVKSYHLLGKAYEKKGDKNPALKNYQKVLELWKDADKDIPDYIEARTRLAKLKGMASK